MIKTEAAYQRTLENIRAQAEHIQSETQRFRDMGLNEEQVALALQPLESYQQQLEEGIQEYENAVAGKFEPLTDLRNIGKTLIMLRIYKGMTQGDLARKMNVALSQVSRDETNEYFGSRTDKLMKVLEAMDTTVTIHLDI